MHIQIDGTHNKDELIEQFSTILQLFLQRYHVQQFREVHLDFTLIDREGEDVELVDNATDQPYRTMRICEQNPIKDAPSCHPPLQLIINNAKGSK